jgi:anti-sigma factor RsiW
MTEPENKSNEWHADQLFSRYLDGSLTAHELAEFEARILADDAFAEHFSRWCLLHRQIHELLAESTLHQLMEQFATGSSALPKKALSQGTAARGQQEKLSDAGASILPANRIPPVGGPGILQFTRLQWQRWLALGTAAAAVMAIAVWISVHRFRNGETIGPLAASRAEREADHVDVVATLTQMVDGVWMRGAPQLTPGQLLPKGTRVALESGMAKVTFDCGAEVVLQGPCDFLLQSQMIGFLKSGKITANVPHRAFSFTILSPQVNFVDLGTAFGVTVGGRGKTELHVFEGEVLCSLSKDTSEHSESIHVTATKALSFDSKSDAPSDIAIDKEQFSPLIDLRRAAGTKLQRLIPDRLALWLAADLGVMTDAAHKVVSWQDILYGDNRSAEDATQNDERARPTLVADALNGRPAVRFDGQSDYLLTTPLETTDDQTVLFVCQFSPSAYDKSRQWGGQILNYDGPPSRYLSNTLEPGVLQIGEPLLAEEFRPTLLTGQVFAGFVGSATVESGRVDAQPIGANVPVVVAYEYDYSRGRAMLSINGRSYGEARAFAPQGITSRKIIGRHAWKQNFFRGDLAELLIYNKALSSQELADTTAYLADKYSIVLNPKLDGNSEAEK